MMCYYVLLEFIWQWFPMYLIPLSMQIKWCLTFLTTCVDDRTKGDEDTLFYDHISQAI